MADGRLFTSYHPHRDYHYRLKHDLSLQNQQELRNQLQTSPDMYLERIEQIQEKNECSNPGLVLPPPARIYRATKEGTEFIDTNIPGGIGIMEESQWNQIQKMQVKEKNEMVKCNPSMYEHLASSQAIMELNRQQSIYAGYPMGLYHQNK